ncbi:hypothetical protein EDD85DRAFT_787933 [Armillaria nabsnona]|nr:hypothetical protein EDD85DRAFT_787933 [Armillaria nabsnona]
MPSRRRIVDIIILECLPLTSAYTPASAMTRTTRLDTNGDERFLEDIIDTDAGILASQETRPASGLNDIRGWIKTYSIPCLLTGKPQENVHNCVIDDLQTFTFSAASPE